ncbi:hypothetical protein EPUL_005820, partial [Erysiphe pulchra]
MKLNRAAFKWLQNQVEKLGNIRVTDDEIAWLEKSCPYLSKDSSSLLAGLNAGENDHQPGEVALSISEAYFKFVDTDWNHDGQREKAKQKAMQLLEGGCAFSEFGSRRRRDYKTHELVMTGLLDAKRDAEGKASPANFLERR